MANQGNLRDAATYFKIALEVDPESSSAVENLAELGKLEAEQGNKSAVIQLKERGNREALLIADHAGTEEFREIFLSRPDVQKVLVS